MDLVLPNFSPKTIFFETQSFQRHYESAYFERFNPHLLQKINFECIFIGVSASYM